MSLHCHDQEKYALNLSNSIAVSKNLATVASLWNSNRFTVPSINKSTDGYSISHAMRFERKSRIFLPFFGLIKHSCLHENTKLSNLKYFLFHNPFYYLLKLHFWGILPWIFILVLVRANWLLPVISSINDGQSVDLQCSFRECLPKWCIRSSDALGWLAGSSIIMIP